MYIFTGRVFYRLYWIVVTIPPPRHPLLLVTASVSIRHCDDADFCVQGLCAVVCCCCCFLLAVLNTTLPVSSLGRHTEQQIWQLLTGRALSMYKWQTTTTTTTPDPRPRGLPFTWWGCFGLCQRQKPTEVAYSFLFCSCVCLCLYCSFNSISFHKFSRQLAASSLCSSGLYSALLVLSVIYFFIKVFLSPDIILSGWLGLKHQLAN